MTRTTPGPVPSAGAPDEAPKGVIARYWWVIGILIAGTVATLAAAFASPDPDGLDRVAIDQGFETAGKDPQLTVLPGYSIPGLDGPVSTIVAAAIGIAVVVLAMLLLGRLLARRRKGTAA